MNECYVHTDVLCSLCIFMRNQRRHHFLILESRSKRRNDSNITHYSYRCGLVPVSISPCISDTTHSMRLFYNSNLTIIANTLLNDVIIGFGAAAAML